MTEEQKTDIADELPAEVAEEESAQLDAETDEDNIEPDSDDIADVEEDIAEIEGDAGEVEGVEGDVAEDSEQGPVDNEEQEEDEAAGKAPVEPLQDTYVVDDVEVTLLSVIESILFASDEPLTPNRIVKILEAGSVKQVRQCIKQLNEKYEQDASAFRIERIAGGYQMMTLNAYNFWLKKLVKVRTDNKLSQAAMETLAIIAYKQPVIRADVEAIRGVSSGEMIRSIMYKGMVKITGRAEILGRPMLYGTTKKFLDAFGLNSLKDLPKIEELKKPQD